MHPVNLYQVLIEGVTYIPKYLVLEAKPLPQQTKKRKKASFAMENF